ncbi:hypothetical protein LguiB_022790 [Lonicera macranthoides]
MQSSQFLLFIFIFITFTVYCPLQAQSSNSLLGRTFKPSAPFSLALESLQKDINYTFQSVDLLRRAMTHASYSQENNKALSVLGSSLIETSVSLRLLTKDIDISAKDLNHWISEMSKVDTSCAVDGERLGLQNVIRVSAKTDSSTPSVVCGAFRAIFGAIAVDTGKSDDAGRIFWRVHNNKDIGRDALAM